MLKKSLQHIDLMQRALQGAWLKNTAITSNIANQNTPGYKRQVVNFQDVLRDEMDRIKLGVVPMSVTHPGHVRASLEPEGIQPEAVLDTQYRVDGNNVDIDVENAEMAKNSIYYNTVVNQVNGEFARLKSALKVSK